MLDEYQIHYMFYENGKRKDRKDPSQRVTRKIYWSKFHHVATIEKISNNYKKTIVKQTDMPFIANLAYCGFSFVEAIDAWRKICNETISMQDSNLVKASIIEILAMVGYLHNARANITNSKENELLICNSIFNFEAYTKLLKCIGIRLEDSKILSRAKNLKEIMEKSLGKSQKVSISMKNLEKEIDIQLNFYVDIAKSMCYIDDNEDLIIYILRYDLKRCI